ncbi:hypothetical protein VPH35_114355 [Triticum aestivum]
MVIHPPWSCELECEDIVDPESDPDSYMACVRECYLGFRNTVCGRAEGEDAREGGGGAGLLAMPVEHAGPEEGEGKRKQEDAAVQLSYNEKTTATISASARRAWSSLNA